MANDHEDDTRGRDKSEPLRRRGGPPRHYQRFMDGWNQGSGDAFASVFTPTATPIRDFALHQFYTAVVMAAQQEMEAPSGS